MDALLLLDEPVTGFFAPSENRHLALSGHERYKSAPHPAVHHPSPHPRHVTTNFSKPVPIYGHGNGPVCVLANSAEAEAQGPIDDDVDADSDDQRDSYYGRPEGQRRKSRMKMEQRGATYIPGTNTGSSSPRPADGEAKFSSHITHIPFDLPELLPVKETTPKTDPLPHHPKTSLLDDIFQPLSSISAPELRLDPFSPSGSATKSSKSTKPRHQPINTGGDPSCRELSLLDKSDQLDNLAAILLVSAEQTLKTVPSNSSLRTTATALSDEPPVYPTRGLFSRFRTRARLDRELDDEGFGFLEKRSLTPAALTAPTPQYSQHSESSIFDRPQPPLPSSSSSFSGGTDRESSSSRSAPENDTTWSFGRKKPKAMGAVFGVDLDKSIEVAPRRIRISHNGMSNSHRTFPLCVHKCCEFIRSDMKDPTLFSSPGNAFHLDQLRRIFSTEPSYGDDFTFYGTDYTVHDAARLLLIYLMDLPKPLVPKSVLKSWILLARQHGAIEPHCPLRIETGLDFWAEALNRLPVANRNLVKHLLGLFVEILTTKTGDEKSMAIDDASARQLAASVSRAMFHSDDGNMSSKTAVHPTLALAFMIRKRGEYIGSLKKEQDRSARSRRGSNMFLPTTEEIMQWRGPSPAPW